MSTPSPEPQANSTPEPTGWMWHGDLTRIPGVVDIPTPFGGRWWADAVAPQQPVAFAAPSLEALVGLSRVFGTRWRDAVLDSAPLGGVSGDDSWAPGEVPSGWARLALVRAVHDTWPYPIDEALLGVDEAVGWQLAGHPERAAAVLAPVAEVLVELVHATHDATLPPAVALDVELAVTIARAGLAETNPDLLAIQAAEAEQPSPDPLSIEELDAALGEWAASQLAYEPAGALAMSAEDSGPDRFIVDPAAVGARVIAWRGPHHRELRATRAADGVLVEFFIADDAEVTDWEVTHLRVYAAVPGAAEPLHAPVSGDEASGRVWALLPVPEGVELSEVVIGVAQTDRGVLPRLGPTGQALAHADRLVCAAWATQRLEHVASPPADSRVLDHLRDARVQLKYVPEHVETSRDLVTHQAYLRHRLDTLERLVSEHATRSPRSDITRPLLAELAPLIRGLSE